jgi:hypothetical protein
MACGLVFFRRKKKFAVGAPARFGLKMKNFGENKRIYDSQGASVNGSIQVTDPDGKPVRYIGGCFQTGGFPHSIAPGEAVVLFDGLDLSDQYLFAKAGSYTFRFRGLNAGLNLHGDSESPIPPSNKLTVEFRPGKLPMSMQVPARLVEIVPKGWDLSLNGRVAEVQDGKIAPPGWESGSGTYLSLTDPTSGLGDVHSVRIWVAEHKLNWRGKGPAGNAINPAEAAVFLGEGADGHVYWTLPGGAEKEWPDIRTKVKTALKIRLRAPKPGKSE